MKNIQSLIVLFVLTSSGVFAQVLSTPNGSVSSNGTTDYVLVNGNTKLVNPNGRTLMLERDDEDSWLTFHDPNNYWYSMGIRRSNNGAFTLNSGGTPGVTDQFVMTSAGNVGIGVASPLNILDVNGVARFRRHGSATSGLTIGNDALSLKGWGSNNPYIEWLNAEGTRQGYLGWNRSRLSLVMENGYNFTVENGNVGIGTSSPNEKLTVNGTIYGKEVRVDLSVPGPDYVFESDYSLPSLEYIEKYITENKHLPEVPSAANMAANGIEVGAMNLLLLKKIEELTLHLIRQEKEINDLKTRINENN